MCVFSCSDLLYLEVTAIRHMVILSLSPLGQEPTGLWSFVISVLNSVKKSSGKTFLMQVFAGLYTGEATLSYWMLQNTGRSLYLSANYARAGHSESEHGR